MTPSKHNLLPALWALLLLFWAIVSWPILIWHSRRAGRRLHRKGVVDSDRFTLQRIA